MEQITEAEMRAGTAPTRAELIMFTPLEEVLKKDSWNDVDVEILIANRNALPKDVYEKLGIADVKPLSEDEVRKQNALLAETVKEVEAQTVEQTTAPVESATADAVGAEQTSAPTTDETVTGGENTVETVNNVETNS